MFKKIWNFFCSVKLTIFLFVLILIPSVVGTVIQQNAKDPTQYVEIYGPTWNAIFKFLGFYDIYHDSRFIILLVLLGLNTFACTINRFRPKWRMAGMFMTHLGLLLILLGSLTGAIFGEKGFMAIGEGEITDKMQSSRANENMATLPFKVKLVDFILDTHEEPSHSLSTFNIRTKKQTNHTVAEGDTVAITRSRWAGLVSLFGLKPSVTATIKVEKFFHHPAAVTSITEGPVETGNEAVEFRIVNGGLEERGYVFAGQEQPYSYHRAHVGVSYWQTENEDLFEEQIEKAKALSKAAKLIEVTLAGQEEVKTYPVEAGKEFKVEGTDYSMEILQYEPDFVILGDGTKSSKSEFPHNPAVHVRLTGPDGVTEQWLFERFPSMHASAAMPFGLRFFRDDRLVGIMDYLVILKAPDAKPVLAHVRKGELVARADVEEGQPIAIEGSQYSLAIDNFFRNANISEEVVDRLDLPPRPSAKLSIEQGGQSMSYYAMAGTPLDVPGYRILYSQDNTIRDFYSVLQIVDEDGSVIKEKKIEVNDPIRHEGYALYQQSYDRERLSWSGLQVKKDPGVPLVYGGFLVQILGMIVIFYINPLVRKAKRARA